ncbi:MAG: hypothetical protein ACRDZ4_15745 [Egibacteraceae bacterium]
MGPKPFSLIVTRNEIVFLPIASDDEHIYGMAGYVALDAEVARACAEGVETVAFGGKLWVKVLGMRYDEYAKILNAKDATMLLPNLGKLARIGRVVRSCISSQDDKLLRKYDSILERLSTALGVRRTCIGLCGSVLYKPAQERADIDFVVYGHRDSLMAYQRVLALVDPHCLYEQNGRIYHWRFKLPGQGWWFDPHFHVSEPMTTALAHGEYVDFGHDDVVGLRVIDDRHGIFYPAHFGLSDGTALLSYRLGHSGWLRKGDRVSVRRLPLYKIGGELYRVVLKQENLSVGSR